MHGLESRGRLEGPQRFALRRFVLSLASPLQAYLSHLQVDAAESGRAGGISFPAGGITTG